MRHEADLAELRQAVQEGGFEAQNPSGEYRTLDFYLQLEGGYAFFRLVGEDENLRDTWLQAQHEVARLRDRWFSDGYLPSLYLVLVWRGELDREDGDIQAIQRDPYLCHKVIVAWPQGETAAEILGNLSFWPVDLPRDTIGAVRPVADTLVEQGYSQEWIQQLLQPRKDVAQIARDLYEDKVKPDGQASDPAQRDSRAPVVPELRAAPNGRWQIGQVEIEGFRGFGQPFQIDLNADLVVMYAPNGTGKTSLCEALEWGLTRQVFRVKGPAPDAPDEADPPVLHVEADRARVALTLQCAGAERKIELTQRRGVNGTEWRIDGQRVTADRDGIRRALGAQLPERHGANWVRDAFRCYHFYEQDTLYYFLREARPDERYAFLQILTQTTEYSLAEERAEQVARVLSEGAAKASEQIAQIETTLGQQTDELKKLEQAAQSEVERVLGTPLGAVHQEALDLALALGIQQRDPEWKRPPGVVAMTPEPIRALAAVLAGPANELVATAEKTLHDLDALPAALADAERRRERLRVIDGNLTANREERTGHEEDRTGVTRRLTELAQRRQTLQEDLESLQAREKRIMRFQETQPRLQPLEALLRSLDTRVRRSERLQEAANGLQAVRAWLEADAALRANQERQPVLQQERAEKEPNLKAQQEEAVRIQREQAAAQAQIAGLKRVLSERNQLLAQLQAHVDSEHCPLCRTAFPDMEALRSAVADSLKLVPADLAQAEKRLLDWSESLGRVNQQCAELARQIGAVQTAITQLEADNQTRRQALEQAAQRLHTILGDVLVDATLARQLETEVAALQNEEAAETEALPSLLQRLREALHGAAVELPVDPAACLAQAQSVYDQWQQEVERLGLSAAERTVPAAVLEEVRRGQRQCGNQLDGLAQQEQEAQDGVQALNQRIDALLEQAQKATAEQLAHQKALDELVGWLQRLQLPADADEQVVEAARRETKGRLDQLNKLRHALSLLNAHANVLDTSRNVQVVRDALEGLRTKRAEHKAEQQRYEVLAEQCRTFRAATSQIRSKLEEERKALYLPTINRLYQRLNLHPYFGKLELKVEPESGTLRIQVRHPETNEPVGALIDYYSAAQLNIAALSIFLTQALLQGWSSLSTIILDDPVQHLDDINTHALLDLLRALATHGRQIIVTTCNRELYKLMLVEFAALNRRESADGRKPFRAYRLYGIGRKGPSQVEDHDILRAIVERQQAAQRLAPE